MIGDSEIRASIDRLDGSTTVAEVLAVVAAFNGETGPEGITASLFERIKEWLEKLVDKLNTLVTKNVQSFTITVGINVSVAVTFRPAA
jgi:hypothetical protein